MPADSRERNPPRQGVAAGLRRAAVMSCVLLTPLLLAGCGPRRDAEHADGKLVVEFWHGMGEREHQELLQRFADEYMATHPGVEVRPVFQGLYGALYQKLIAAITAGSPPAMAQMYESWTTRLYERGRLVPVEKFVHGGNGYSDEELSDFFGPFLDDSRWGDTLVTLPFNKSAYVLQYNADLLKRAGVDEAPKDWDELLAAARAVSKLKTDDGRSCRGFMIRPQLESFATMFFSAGGSFLDGKGQPMMTTPVAHRSMDYLQKMIDEDLAVVDRNYPSVVLGSGTLGMYIYSSASFPFNDRLSAGKFQWMAAPVPGPADTDPARRRTLFQGYNVGLLSGHSPEVTAAAWDFLKYMLEPAQVARWSIQTGYCPLRRTVLERGDIKKYLEENPAYGVPVSLVEKADFEPKPDYWESWRTAVGDEVGAALQGIKSVDNALLDAQAAGEEALRYDSKFPRRPAHSAVGAGAGGDRIQGASAL